MKLIPAFTIATLICSPALASEQQFADSTLDFGELSKIFNIDPNEVHITDHAFDGDGCPEGTVQVDFSPDGRSFAMLFAGLFLEAFDTVPGQNSSKISCEISITIHVPENKALRLVTYNYSGATFTGSDDTLKATFTSTYSIAESRQSFGFFHIFRATNLAVTLSDELILTDQSQSNCGGDVNITTLLNLSVHGSGGGLYIDSVDSGFGLTSEIELLPCES